MCCVPASFQHRFPLCCEKKKKKNKKTFTFSFFGARICKQEEIKSAWSSGQLRRRVYSRRPGLVLRMRDAASSPSDKDTTQQRPNRHRGSTFKYNFIQVSEAFIYADIWIFSF